MATAVPSARRTRRPALGLRRQPGRLALTVFRLPLLAYRHDMGWVLGRTFMELTHQGRRTGRQYSTVAMVLRYVPDAPEVTICSAWGAQADWIQNLQAGPAVRVRVGRRSFTPDHRFLSVEEGVDVLAACLTSHPWRFRLISAVLGWGDLRDPQTARALVATRPFVTFWPRTELGGDAERQPVGAATPDVALGAEPSAG